MKIIKEEVEVVLTNAEAIEMFNLDPAALLEVMLDEGDGKDCADTEKGCIRQRDGQWVILNNKKGGIWRKCGTGEKGKKKCQKMLAGYHKNK